MTVLQNSSAIYEILPENKILFGDCIEEMGKFPPKSVDLIFADPPYNLQLQSDLYRPDMTKVDKVDDEWDQFASYDDYDLFTNLWIGACQRVLKDTGAIWIIGSYHNIYRVGKILMDNGFWILNDVIWVKSNPMPNFKGVRFTNANETLLWAQKKKGSKYTFNYKAMKGLNNGKQMRSTWEIPICGGSERIRIEGVKAHSTQKPEELLKRVILSSSRPNDLILDPFFGSGTTGVVAKRYHRKWLGIERDKTYIKVANERINNTVPVLEGMDPTDPKNDPKLLKVTFGTLIDMSIISPGTILRFRNTLNEATVLANGTLESGEITGSIHQVGSKLSGQPCNGWEHWYYLRSEDNSWQVIDNLRTNARRILTQINVS